MQKFWVIAENEWLLSVRSPKFWLATLLTPVILFVIYFLIQSVVVSDAREKLLETAEAEQWQDLLEQIVQFNGTGKSGVQQYAVVDESEVLAAAIRKRIVNNDQQLFLTQYFNRNSSQYNVLVAALGENAAQDLERIVESTDEKLRESSPRILDQVFGSVRGTDESATGDIARFAEEFSRWWTKYFEQIKNAVPLLSVNAFEEVLLHDRAELLAEAASKLDADEIIGYFVLPSEVLEDSSEATFFVREGTRRRDYLYLVNWYQSVTTEVLIRQRLIDAQFDDETQYRLAKSVNFSTDDFAEILPSSFLGEGILGRFLYVVLALGLFFIFFISSGRLIGIMVDEKSSKLVDILLVKVPQSQLLDGKLWGTLLISLTVVFAWIVVAAIFGLSAKRWDLAIDPALIALLLRIDVVLNFLLFMVLAYALFGYFFLGFSTMFSQVSTATGVSLMVLTGLGLVAVALAICVPFIPSATLLNVMSFFPLSTPFMMVARSGELPDWPMYCSIVLFTVFCVLGSRALGIWMFKRGISVEMKVTATTQ